MNFLIIFSLCHLRKMSLPVPFLSFSFQIPFVSSSIKTNFCCRIIWHGPYFNQMGDYFTNVAVWTLLTLVLFLTKNLLKTIIKTVFHHHRHYFKQINNIMIYFFLLERSFAFRAWLNRVVYLKKKKSFSLENGT